MVKKRYLFPLINTAALIGCAAALFVVPPDTSLKLYLFVCLGVIAAINVALAYRLRNRQPGVAPKPADKFSSVVVWIGFGIFLFGVIRGIIRYRHHP